jgi:hypothetical protein
VIALVVTLGTVVLSVWLLSFVSVWIAALWLVWLIAGITWFIINMGNKTSPDKWYDRILLAPVLPLAWMFDQIDARCALTIRK